MKPQAVALTCLMTLIAATHAATPNARVVNSEALQACQKALRSAARDPEKAEVPDVGAMHGGADWRFLWNANSRVVRMQNGLGAQVAVTALCVVDEDNGRIKLLTLDGKQLVAPGKAM